MLCNWDCLHISYFPQAIIGYMHKSCACIGTKQCLCEKTCQMELPTMDGVADVLKKKYDQSSYAMIIPSPSPQQVLVVERESRKTVHPYRMIYFDPSPNYCTADPYYNIAGIAGRECTLDDSSSSHHCNNLCCDHGHETFTYKIKKPCNGTSVCCCHATEAGHRCRKHPDVQESTVHQGMYFDKTFFSTFCNLVET